MRRIVRQSLYIFSVIALVCAVFVFSGQKTTATSAINRQVNYQGKLLTAAGLPVADGNYLIGFSIYNAATGGTRLWTASGTTVTPSAVSVAVSNGLFSVLLGDTTSQNAFDFDWYQQDLHLGVTVASDSEMAPRKRLSAVPYAFVAETLQGQYASSAVESTGGALFSLRQHGSDAATSNRSALYISTSGTSNVFDYLIKGSNGSEVFSVNRLGHVTTTGNLDIGGNIILGNDVGDVLTVNGRLGSDLIPTTNSAINLGSALLSYQNIYASGTIMAGDGSVTAPSFANGTNTGSGMYFPNSGQTAISAGGVQLALFSGGVVQVNGQVRPSTNNARDLGTSSLSWANFYASGTSHLGGAIYATSGSVTAPAYSFEADPDTGMYTSVAGTLGFSANGANLLTLSSAGTAVFNTRPRPLTTNLLDIGTPALSWANIYASGTAYIGTDVIVAGQSVCLEDGTNCGVGTGSNWTYSLATDSLSPVTSTTGIRIGGNIVPTSNETVNLGSATESWKDVYASGTAYIDDDIIMGGGLLSIRRGGSSHWIDFLDTSGVTQWYFSENTAGDFNLGETGVANGRVYVKAGGNVGIGTTSPNSFKLEIAGSLGMTANNLYDIGSAATSVRSIYASGTVYGVTAQFSSGTNAILSGNGTVNNPTYSFVSQNNLGLFTPGTNQLGFSVGGVTSLTLSQSFAQFAAGIVLRSTTNNSNDIGSASLSWKNIYASGTYYGVTAQFSSGTNAILAGDGTASNPAYSFTGDPDVGMYRIGSNSLGFAGGSSLNFGVNVGSANISYLQFRTAGANPLSTNTYDLGSPSASWKDIYASGTAYVGGVISSGNVSPSVSGGANLGDSQSKRWNNLFVSGVVFGGSSFSLANFSAQHASTTEGIYLGSGGGSFASREFILTGETIAAGATHTLSIIESSTSTLKITNGTNDGGWGNLSVGTIYATSGSAAAPAYTFESDTNSGFYSVGDNTIGIATNGILQFSCGAAICSNRGAFRPMITNNGDLGSANLSWKDFYASGTAYIGTDVKVGLGAAAQSVCLEDGTNCGVGTGSNWTYSLATDSLSPVTSTTGIRIGGNIVPTSNGTVDLGSATESWNSIYVSGTSHLGGAIYATGGSASAPAYSFEGDSNSGLYRLSADNIGITAGSVTAALFSSTGAGFRGGTFSAPGIRFFNNQLTGIYGNESNFLGITINGTSRVGINATDTTFLTNVIPSSTNAYDLGSASMSWKDIYASGTAYIDTAVRAGTWGTAASPIFVNKDDPDTGMYFPADNQLALALGGTNALTLATGLFTANATIRPSATNFYDLGTEALSWQDVYASGTVYIGKVGTAINLSNDITLSYSLNNLTIGGGNLNVGGSILPSSNNTYAFGSPSLSWKNIYASGTVYGVTAQFSSGTNAILAGDGTASNPAYSFIGDPDTGIYRTGANGIGFAAGAGLSFGINIATNNVSYLTLRPNGTNTLDLGRADASWKDFYASGTAYIGTDVKVGLGAAAQSVCLEDGTNCGVGTGSNWTYTLATDSLSPVTSTTGIRIGGNIVPTSNGTIDLGTPDLSWDNIYASGTIMAGAGSVATPSFANGLDVSSGLYFPATGQSAISAGGFQIALFTGGTTQFNSLIRPSGNNTRDIGAAALSWKDIYASGTSHLGGAIYATSGSATAPAYSFEADTDTGIYTQGNILAFATAGAERMRLIATGSDVASDWRPRTQNTYDLGTAPLSWKNIYASGTAYIGTAVSSTRFFASAGSAAAPAYSVGGNTNGLFWTGLAVGLSTGGTQVFKCDGGDCTSAQMLIVNGIVRPATNNTRDLGTPAFSWKDVYASGTVYGVTARFSSSTNSILVGSGNTPASPSYSFINSTTSGMYAPAQGQVAISSFGSISALFSSGVVELSGNVRPRLQNTYDLGQAHLSWKNFYASGTAYIGTDVLVGGTSVCLEDGTNCPAGFGSTDLNWTFDLAGDFVRNATATTDLVLGSTATSTAPFYLKLDGASASSNRLVLGQNQNLDLVIGNTTSSGLNSLFQLTGNDLYVEGNIGSASSVYTNGAFIVGTTYYAEGYIADPNGLAIVDSDIPIMSISSNGTHVDMYSPTTGYYFRFGDAAETTHSLGQNDVLLTQKLEVDGHAYFDSGVSSTGNILPTANGTYNLGSADLSWQNVYATGTVYGVTARFTSSSNAVLVGTGNVNAPAYSFIDSTNMGMYRSDASTVAIKGQSQVILTIPVETLRLASGYFGTLSNNSTDLGRTNFSWENIYASGTAYIGTDVKVGLGAAAQSVCLEDGTNCPASSGGSSYWTYDFATDILLPVTSTTDVVIGDNFPNKPAFHFNVAATTSRFYVGAYGSGANVVIGDTTSTISNNDFQLTGDDLYVAGNIGSASSVYTNGEFLAGQFMRVSDMDITVVNRPLGLYTLGAGDINLDPIVGGAANINLGGTFVDGITFTAQAASDLVPDTHDTWTLGGNLLRWKGFFSYVTSSYVLASNNSGLTGGGAGEFLKGWDTGLANAKGVVGLATGTELIIVDDIPAMNAISFDGAGTAVGSAGGFFVNGVGGTHAEHHPAMLALDKSSSTNGGAILGARACGNSTTGNILHLATNTDSKRMTVRCSGQIFADNGTVGTPGDYAEFFHTTDTALVAGDVIAFAGAHTSSVKRTVADDRNMALGVVSARPLVLGNAGPDGAYENNPNYVAVGLLGQLPVKASNANGTIEAGDFIMASDDGRAIKASGAGMVIGRAMETLSTMTGMILAYVSPHWSGADILSGDANTLVINPPSFATASSTSVDSSGLTFRGSVWNASSGAAISSDFTVLNDVADGGSSALTIRAATDTLLTISDAGDVWTSGDLSVGNRLFLGSKSSGRASTSTYLYVDDTDAASTYIATNADGWATNDTYDYAERFVSDDGLRPGDLVVADPNGMNKVKRHAAKTDTILGIVSTRPGFITGAHATDTHPIALAGRVPTRVLTTNGSIAPGDYLAPSDTPGVAVKAAGSGPTVGVALEAYDAPTEGLISVFVQPGWRGGEVVQETTAPSSVTYVEYTDPGVSPRAGLAAIAAGAKEVNVSFPTLNSYPLVTITPYGLPAGGWGLLNVNDHGFTIVLEAEQSFDLTLAWKAEPSQDGAEVWFSDGTSAPYDPTSGQAVMQEAQEPPLPEEGAPTSSTDIVMESSSSTATTSSTTITPEESLSLEESTTSTPPA